MKTRVALLPLLMLSLASCSNGKEHYIYKNIDLTIIRESDYEPQYRYDIKELAALYQTELEKLALELDAEIPETLYVELHNGSFKYNDQVYAIGGALAFYDIPLIKENMTMYFIYDKKANRHEIVHILMGRKYGPSRSGLMTEGFAMAFDPIYGTSIFERIKQIPKRTILELSDNASAIDQSELYINAGIFMTWFINNYGLDTAQKLYAASTQEGFIITRLEDYIGIRFDDLEREYAKVAY